MLYLVYLHGGPLDGEISYCFRPYFELIINGHIYRAEKYNSQEDYVQWLDDDKRTIDLHHVDRADPK